MTIQIQEPLSWESQPENPHIPIYREGKLVAYCHPDYVQQIVDAMNEEEKVRKALRFACADLIRTKKENSTKVDDLMAKYIAKTERPKFGPQAIAVLLIDRQKELRLSTPEFIKFCDTYKLSAEDIKNLATGKPIDPILINPIARILGVSAVNVKEVLNGNS